MATRKPTFGIVGVGGYGGEVCRDLLKDWDNLPVQFIATAIRGRSRCRSR